MAELLATADRDHGWTTGSARVKIGHGARANSLVGVMGGLELDLLRIGSDLGHMVHITTAILHVLLSACNGELLRAEDRLLRLRNR